MQRDPESLRVPGRSSRAVIAQRGPGRHVRGSTFPRTAGPGLHLHTREDEAAFVVSGVMTFLVGDRRFEAGTGELVWLPREVPHTYSNLGNEPVWALGVISPSGLEGMFTEQAQDLESLQGPPDSDIVRQIGDRSRCSESRAAARTRVTEECAFRWKRHSPCPCH